MIGGNKEKEYRQFRVNPDSMSVDVLEDLPFPFNYGSYHEYNDDFALACAGADNKEHCWELSGATDQCNKYQIFRNLSRLGNKLLRKMLFSKIRFRNSCLEITHSENRDSANDIILVNYMY